MICEVSFYFILILIYFIIFLSFALVDFLIFFFVGILAGPDSGVMEDDQVILDPNSNLGMFLRRCILAFNLLMFEVFLSCLIINFCAFVVSIICLLWLRYTWNCDTKNHYRDRVISVITVQAIWWTLK